MLRPDPLDWFTHEKIAEDSPSFSPSDRYQIPEKVDPKALDPGERAIAGMLSSAASISSKVLPMIGSAAAHLTLANISDKWEGAPLQDLGSFREGASRMLSNIDSPSVQKGNILGLIDIKREHPKLLDLENLEMGETYAKQHARLQELSDVADSFIDKHQLREKGVRINLQRGPLSGSGGGSYHLDTKRVYLPSLSNEVALHELGHAADYNTRIGRFRGIAESALSNGVHIALPIALAAGDRIKEMIPGTVDDKAISFMQDHAPGIMAATLTATTLYPEAKASISAIRHIRDLERAGRQPVGATMKAVKRLSPMFGSYLLGAVPAVIGMALARKYMNQAREEKAELHRGIEIEKVGSMLRGLRDVVEVGRQVGRGSIDLIRKPDTLRRIGRAAKDVGTSPEFVYGALGTAVPATLGALYMYGTRGGEEMRGRLSPKARDTMLRHGGPVTSADDEWRSGHPLRFAGLVGLGAALSGGIMSRFLSDLTRVL